MELSIDRIEVDNFHFESVVDSSILTDAISLRLVRGSTDNDVVCLSSRIPKILTSSDRWFEAIQDESDKNNAFQLQKDLPL